MIEEMLNILRLLKTQNPCIIEVNVDDLVDNRFIRKLDESGFFERTYCNAGRWVIELRDKMSLDVVFQLAFGISGRLGANNSRIAYISEEFYLQDIPTTARTEAGGKTENLMFPH